MSVDEYIERYLWDNPERDAFRFWVIINGYYNEELTLSEWNDLFADFDASNYTEGDYE